MVVSEEGRVETVRWSSGGGKTVFVHHHVEIKK